MGVVVVAIFNVYMRLLLSDLCIRKAMPCGDVCAYAYARDSGEISANPRFHQPGR